MIHFLCEAQVSGYELGGCSCGEGRETPRHAIIHCPREEAEGVS